MEVHYVNYYAAPFSDINEKMIGPFSSKELAEKVRQRLLQDDKTGANGVISVPVDAEYLIDLNYLSGQSCYFEVIKRNGMIMSVVPLQRPVAEGKFSEGVYHALAEDVETALRRVKELFPDA